MLAIDAVPGQNDPKRMRRHSHHSEISWKARPHLPEHGNRRGCGARFIDHLEFHRRNRMLTVYVSLDDVFSADDGFALDWGHAPERGLLELEVKQIHLRSTRRLSDVPHGPRRSILRDRNVGLVGGYREEAYQQGNSRERLQHSGTKCQGKTFEFRDDRERSTRANVVAEQALYPTAALPICLPHYRLGRPGA